MNTSNKIKLAVRIAAVILIVLFFVPTVTVSCSDMVVEISAFDAAAGNVEEKVSKEMGEGLMEDMGIGDMGDLTGESSNDIYAPNPILYILIVFAAAMLVIANKNAIASIILAISSAIVMFLFKSGVADRVKEDGMALVKVKTTPWFTVHIIVCVAIVLMLLYDKFVLQAKKPQNTATVGGGYGQAPGYQPPQYTPPQYNANQYNANQYNTPQYAQPQYNSNPNPTPNTAGCQQCGAPLMQGATFCSRCGSPVVKEQPKIEKFCPQCGTKYTEGQPFCVNCGNKLN